MLIIGAKGFAKEVLEVLQQLKYEEKIYFYDDVSNDLPESLYSKYKILRSLDEVKEIYENQKFDFTLGVGKPLNRKKLYNKFIQVSGAIQDTISPYAHIGEYNKIETGVNIMTGSIITNDVIIGKGCLININATIGHDCILDKFVELSPGVHISGHCKIGQYSSIGTGAVVLPTVNIGTNVIVGAGSVINKDIDDNSVVVGVPGRVIKKLQPVDE